MEHLFATENLPFSIALTVMCFIAALEFIGILLGHAPSELVHSFLPQFDTPDLDAPDVDLVDVGGSSTPGTALDVPGIDSDGIFTKLLGWLSFGKVPVLIWLVVFLASFGLSGLMLQAITKSILGAYMHSSIASVPALVIAAPMTGKFGKALARILPKDESEAVSRDAFVGRIAHIIRGTASSSSPAEAKLTDQHNLTHYILVIPDIETESFNAGSQVLIVSKDGNLFRVINSRSTALTS